MLPRDGACGLPSIRWPALLLQAWPHAGRYPGYWPALHLLVEVELQVGTQDSHLRALNRLQTFCSGMQALLDSSAATGKGAEQGLWYRPSTWLGQLKPQEAEVQRLPLLSPCWPVPCPALHTARATAVDWAMGLCHQPGPWTGMKKGSRKRT